MSGAHYAQTLATQIRSRIADRGERGAGLVEYALLLVLVLLVAFASIKIFGDSVVAAFGSSGEAFDKGGVTTSSN